MQHTHPFYIWQVLMRFRTMDKLIGVEHQWRSQSDIARQLFSNFDDLSEYEQERVIFSKIRYPMVCLKSGHYVEERFELVDNPEYYKGRTWLDRQIQKGQNEWRARPHAFGDWEFYSVEQRQQTTAEHIDESWRRFTGQMNKYDKAERWLKKRGLLV
jgi:hypothetical protein